MAADLPELTVSVDPASQGAPAAADPLWYKDAVIYQAHVKSFYDSNQDGIGDFRGLTEKLDYLQDLGVTCVWLLPFFPSPLRDDGYDIADYLNVHQSYGSLADFKAFVHAAHERHLKVLIELVVNHTSDQHPWFQRARRAPRDSPERDFYVWSDTDKDLAGTRIIFVDTEKSNWTWDEVAGQYYWHRFFSHQPDLNHNNPAVVDAVIDVMKFWLDLGVDALRLDAVPYLCVREGTSNENLPETHEVLKRMRQELDAAYPNRMLLAEANQWPSDVRAYFGDGDECHMAFHFPLMPRIFMALRQEERHAITEILGQTPDIPETCQWALFLRNHDELTLEMVTDEERDYMYSAYAADPQMRLNVGIRRRLAPLVENNRRRAELLNSLLFSLPGTPIVYYGDEIGMGDNIYLGDRNGVRTPMQWSGDRNGGFSRSDPARLYAPPIMDPVYGYQAINVEAQERYPFSLLNWMKRLIAMRRQHRVFGRGSLEFVSCSNRKALAFLRRDERETILVVINLARTVQPVELDLCEVAGLIPVEMWGLTEFPRIGESPYVLTLGPYASYWFVLEREPMQLASKITPVTDAVATPTVLVGVEWQTLLDGGARAIIERQALRPFLLRQRWFTSKSREIRSVRFSDWTTLRPGPEPAFLSIVSLEYTDESAESYLLPLTLVADEAAGRLQKDMPGAVVARIGGARKGAIVDGVFDDDVCDRLVGLVAGEREVTTALGAVQGRLASSGLDDSVTGPDRKWTRGPGDQSNTVAFLNDRFVLKLFRRIEPEINPEVEIGRFLTTSGFSRIPRLVGTIDYLRPQLTAASLAIVQAAVAHQGSGWEYTIEDLRRFYERVAASVHGTQRPDSQDPREGLEVGPGGESGPAPLFATLEHWYLETASLLGRRTAELHLALATGTDEAFRPEPLDAEALQELAAAMRVRAAAALDLLERRLSVVPEAWRNDAEALLSGRERLLARFEALGRLHTGGKRIRIHGDYHLAQVLWTDADFVILDFEGEPARSAAERRAKQSPLKDVAGMLRSYSYAAYAALFAFTLHAPDDFPVLEPWAEAWRHWTSEAFLRDYRTTMSGAGLVPADDHVLLDAFVAEKAFYELAYELNSRPEWVRIPIAGLLKML